MPPSLDARIAELRASVDAMMFAPWAVRKSPIKYNLTITNSSGQWLATVSDRDAAGIVALRNSAMAIIDALSAENAILSKRLEIAPGAPDGISCRDETIRLQDQRIDELRAENAKLRGAMSTAVRHGWCSGHAEARGSDTSEKADEPWRREMFAKIADEIARAALEVGP